MKPRSQPGLWPHPVDGRTPRNRQETRDATLTEGLVNHAESLRTQKENNTCLCAALNHVLKTRDSLCTQDPAPTTLGSTIPAD